MFEHLNDPVYAELADLPPMEVVGAAIKTADWMTALGVGAPMADTTAADLARKSFTSLTAGADPSNIQITNVSSLRAPAAVQHLVGMLSAYDWAFVEQAKELRGYVVAKLLEETTHPDARIRLKALELTGKLTEVASFTERSEVTHKNEDTSVVEERLRARLKAMLPPVQEVQDTEVKAIAVKKKTAP